MRGHQRLATGISGIPKVSFFGLMSFNVSDPNYPKVLNGIAQSGAYFAQDIPTISPCCWLS